MLLVRRDLDARAGHQRLLVATGELAVVGVAERVEQHVAFSDIRVAAGDQLPDHRDDLRQMLGDTRGMIRSAGAEVRTVAIGTESCRVRWCVREWTSVVA